MATSCESLVCVVCWRSWAVYGQHESAVEPSGSCWRCCKWFQAQGTRASSLTPPPSQALSDPSILLLQIINLHIPLHDTQGANHALGEFFRMPPSGSDMIVWHNGFDDQERACLEQLERGYSRMLENTKRRRESGKIKKMHERSNVDPALLGKMTGDYADTVLGFARAFDAFVERVRPSLLSCKQRLTLLPRR